jgi:hypothetical protein
MVSIETHAVLCNPTSRIDLQERSDDRSRGARVGKPSIVVTEYDPAWPLRVVARARARHPGRVGRGVEHVPLAVGRLERAGYRHEGDLGIQGREAFEPPPDAPWHHLYVLPADSEELRRHLAFRNHLRVHPEVAIAYAALKREAARRFGGDRRAYTEAKTDFVERVLAQRPERGAR